MNACVIYDLDNTLVDSDCLKSLRDARRWNLVYARLNEVVLFNGIAEMWQLLRESGVYLAVVTHAPRPYSERVLCRVGIEAMRLVCYHDLGGRKKPSPRGYELASAELAGVVTLAVGDQIEDLIAADRFGCEGVFAGWSRCPVINEKECVKRGWHYVTRPRDVVKLVASSGSRRH